MQLVHALKTSRQQPPFPLPHSPLPLTCTQAEGQRRITQGLVDMEDGLVASPTGPGFFSETATFDSLVAELGGHSPFAQGLKDDFAAEAPDVSKPVAKKLVKE